MSKWLYPDEKLLRAWVIALERSDFLSEYLPPIDESWLNAVIKSLELLKFDLYPDDFYIKAAYVIYRVCKNHYLIDSNKRSSIIVLYLFCIMNRHVITCSPDIVKNLAEDIAKINGSDKYEEDIKTVESTLKKIVRPI